MDENNLQAERSVQQNDDGVVMDQELPTTGPEIMPAHRLGDAGVARPTAAVTPMIVQRRPTPQQRMEGQAALFNIRGCKYAYRYCSIGTLHVPPTFVGLGVGGIEIDLPKLVCPRGEAFSLLLQMDKIIHVFAAVNTAFSPIFISVIKKCEDDIKMFLDFNSTGNKLDCNSKNVLEKYIILVPAASSGPSSQYLTDLEVASLTSAFKRTLANNPQQNAHPTTSEGGSLVKPVAMVNPIFCSADVTSAEPLVLPCDVCTVGTLFFRPMGRVAITGRGLELVVPGASRGGGHDVRLTIRREEIVYIRARPPLPGVRIWVTEACAARVSEQLHIEGPHEVNPRIATKMARHIVLYPSLGHLSQEEVMLCLEVMSLLSRPHKPPPAEPAHNPPQPTQ